MEIYNIFSEYCMHTLFPMQVFVEFDHEKLENRRWIRVYEPPMKIFLVEHSLTFAARKWPGSATAVQWPAVVWALNIIIWTTGIRSVGLLHGCLLTYINSFQISALTLELMWLLYCGHVSFWINTVFTAQLSLQTLSDSVMGAVILNMTFLHR